MSWFSKKPKEGRWFTNGNGVFVECFNGYYHKITHSGNAPIIARVDAKEKGIDTREYFTAWKPITEAEYQRQA